MPEHAWRIVIQLMSPNAGTENGNHPLGQP